MTENPAERRADLDRGASARQAFGSMYRRAADQDARLELVLQGTLRLPPHPDWTGDVTDWHADPFSDRNWQFQHHTLRWINPLRWAAVDGDDAARDEWIRIARSWGAANLPAIKDPKGFAWKDMADGNRAIELSLGAPFVTAEDDWYVELLRAHVTWLLDPENIVRKNHALHQHCGLFVAAATLRDAEAMTVATRRMTEQFGSTFDEQGANDEGAVGYHDMNLQWWGQAWARVEAEGQQIPDFAVERLRRGREALAHLTLPNAQLPQIGDTKRQRVGRDHGPHVEFIVSKGKKGEPLEDLAVAFSRGYVVSRSGWGQTRPLKEESHMILRFGEDIRAHAHQDRGSVHLYALGRPWLTDSGFHSYQNGDQVREHFLTREAHNLPFLLDREHDDRAPVELEEFLVDTEFHCAVVHDRGYPGIELRRRVLYLVGPDCWIIQDETRPAEVLTQHWHVDIGVEVLELEEPGRVGLRAEGDEVVMTWLGKPLNLQIHPAEQGGVMGWISTKWKTLEAGTLVTATAEDDTGKTLLVVAPSSPSRLEISRADRSSESSMRLNLRRGARSWDVSISTSNIEVHETTGTALQEQSDVNSGKGVER